MKGWGVIEEGVLPGALAGLIGGLVFGAALYRLDMLPWIASLAGAELNIIGMVVHLISATIIGAGFGVLTWHQKHGAGEILFWGLTYGILWWFLGPLTLMPLLLGERLIWDIHAVQAVFPSLVGHLWYGISTALALTVMRARHLQPNRLGIATFLRGSVAGLLAGWLLGKMLDAQGQLLAFSSMMMSTESQMTAWLLILSTGLLAGFGYALLYPRLDDSAGAGLIRGTVYGFLWWVIGALTLLPLLDRGELAWSLETARSSFAFLPGYIIFGATLALLYQWFEALGRIFFADIPPRYEQEGIGTQGLRVLSWGALAGSVGGLLFTLVMVQIGFLPAVAGLVNSTSATTGFLVHLGISILIGVSYGLLFRRQSYDIGSALGWGASYGFFWWILGPLTLMPILLGTTPKWNIEIVVGFTASLIGHLAYGAGLAITFHLLEARHSPWWTPHRQVEAARIKRRKEQLFTSAPALWVMVVIIALTVPVVLGM